LKHVVTKGEEPSCFGLKHRTSVMFLDRDSYA
jgi:hypothetical protein